MENQDTLEKAFQKLLKKMLSEKYPMYLDVHVFRYRGADVIYSPKKSYEIFLVILDKDSIKMRPQLDEVKKYILGLARYMDIRIHGIYIDAVDEEQWEEMKSDKKD